MNKLVVAAAVVLFAATFKPLLLPYLREIQAAPPDLALGTLPVPERAEELRPHYRGKRVLLIGGTRGVGFGTAQAMVRAQARVTVVGRSEASGRSAVATLRALREHEDDPAPRFLRGDLGTVADAKKLVETIVSLGERFDFLVVTAATFPNWEAPLLNEDGIDKSYAIAVVGRFLLYRNMHRFMTTHDARVLNVLASGEKFGGLDRELASGSREASGLLENMMTFALGNELMQIGLHEQGNDKTTRVSTHPGLLKTDLHRGQGMLFDLLETVLVAVLGVSEEDCGVRMAGMLASDRLHPGGLSYVDESNHGRLRSPYLQHEVDQHLEWLWSQLLTLESA